MKQTKHILVFIRSGMPCPEVKNGDVSLMAMNLVVDTDILDSSIFLKASDFIFLSTFSLPFCKLLYFFLKTFLQLYVLVDFQVLHGGMVPILCMILFWHIYNLLSALVSCQNSESSRDCKKFMTKYDKLDELGRNIRYTQMFRPK